VRGGWLGIVVVPIGGGDFFFVVDQVFAVRQDVQEYHTCGVSVRRWFMFMFLALLTDR
jgi:hypothetical protein